MTEEQPSPAQRAFPTPAPGEARRQWQATHPSGEAYTGWFRRRFAYVVDFLLVLVLTVILGVIGSVIARTGPESVVWSINVVVWLAYWLWNWGYRQGVTGSSVGKSLLKFKVVSEETGQPIGFSRSVVRQIVHLLDLITVVGFALPLVTAKKQTIADIIMGTVFVPIE
jgi:uncharacterized RDD family membrane protein YckC